MKEKKREDSKREFCDIIIIILILLYIILIKI